MDRIIDFSMGHCYEIVLLFYCLLLHELWGGHGHYCLAYWWMEIYLSSCVLGFTLSTMQIFFPVSTVMKSSQIQNFWIQLYLVSVEFRRQRDHLILSSLKEQKEIFHGARAATPSLHSSVFSIDFSFLDLGLILTSFNITPTCYRK